jgi:hypothetical protein
MVPGCRHGRGRSGRAGRHSEQEDAHCPGPRCNLGGLPGRVRQQPGRSTFDGPSGTSTVRGSVAGVALTALVAQQDRVARPSGYATTTNLTGSVGRALTSLVGAFDLDAGNLFRQGTITGADQGRIFRARAQPNLVGGIGSAADLSGTIEATPFALFANLPVDRLGTGTATIGGHRDHFEMSPTTQHGNFPTVRLTGDYSGPIDLLALIVGAIAYVAA